MPASPLLPRQPPGGRGALESAFKMAAKGPEQRSVVMEELLETRVQQPTERQFSEEVGETRNVSFIAVDRS